MAFRGDSLPIGTRVRVIDSGKSIHGQDGCSGIFDYGVTNVGVFGIITDKENQDGISPNDPGINICVDGDTIWRIHPNSQLEIVQLPSKYWIKNDGNSEEFAKLFNEVFNDDIFGGSEYYAISNGEPTEDYEDDTSIYPNWPVYTFEQWKSVVRPVASKKVEEKVEDKPVFKEGDWVVITNDGQTYSAFETKFIELGFKNTKTNIPKPNGTIGQIFWAGEHGEYDGDFILALNHLDGSQSLINVKGVRKATREEIKQAIKPKIGDKYIVLQNCKFKGEIVTVDNLTVPGSYHDFSCENGSIWSIKDGQVRKATPKEIAQAHENNSNNSNNFSSINQSQLKNQTNEKNSSSSGNTVKDEEECIISKSRKPQGVSAYLPGDQERISVGQRRKGIAVRG